MRVAYASIGRVLSIENEAAIGRLVSVENEACGWTMCPSEWETTIHHGHYSTDGERENAGRRKRQRVRVGVEGWRGGR